MTLSDMPRGLFEAYLFCVGACVGSFLGVVVARLPAELSIITPRSYCDRCKTPIRWQHNLPLLSYLYLRGRCASCGAPYGLRHLLLEVLTGLLFVALGQLLGPSLLLLWWLVFASGLIAITFLDIDHFWVPDVITFPLMAWALAATALPVGPKLTSALWGLFPAALLWAVAWLFERIMGKEGLGFGDIKLLAALGLMMGLPATLTLLFLGSLQGAIIGSIVLALGGHQQLPLPEMQAAQHTGEHGLPLGEEVAVSEDDEPWVPDPKAVPFGPFLVLATFEVLFFPNVFAHMFNRLIAGG